MRLNCLVEPFRTYIRQYNSVTVKYTTCKKSRKVLISYNHAQNAEESCSKEYMRFGEGYNASKETMMHDMRVVADFLTEEDERSLFEEIEPYMRRLRYEFDHWDDVSELVLPF